MVKSLRLPTTDAPALERYTPALRRYFRRHLNLAEVYDLVQEVFIGMKARQSSETIRNLDGYIFSGAANILRHHRRQNALARQLAVPIDGSESIPCKTPSAERTLLGREGLTQAPFDRYRGAEVSPGPTIQSDAEIDRFVCATPTGLWHPVGTARMGVDADAVVDAQLKVNGVTGLRVADASIMPTVVSTNTNAAVIMIAGNAAAMILEDARRP